MKIMKADTHNLIVAKISIFKCYPCQGPVHTCTNEHNASDEIAFPVKQKFCSRIYITLPSREGSRLTKRECVRTNIVLNNILPCACDKIVALRFPLRNMGDYLGTHALAIPQLHFSKVDVGKNTYEL